MADMGITPLLYKVAHKCSILQSEKLKELSISFPQAVILGIVAFVEDGTVNQRMLSEEMCIKESSVSSIIKTMIKNGLICKEQSKNDGRNNILKITDKGNEIVDKINSSLKSFEDKLYGQLTNEERKIFINLLEKLI